MAWLTTDTDALTEHGSVCGTGTDEFYFDVVRRSNGDQILFVSYSYPDSTSSQVFRIYKNGTSIFEDNSATGYLSTTPPWVVNPYNDKCFYIKITKSSEDVTLSLYEYDIEAESSTLKDTINGESRGNYSGYGGASICFDPTTGKMYVSFGSSNFVLGGSNYDSMYIKEYSSAGVVDHTVFSEQRSSSSQRRKRTIIGSAAYSGTLYFCVQQETHLTWTNYMASINCASVDATSWTTIDSRSYSGAYRTYERYLILPYGLWIEYGTTTLTSPGATSWDLSSYLDSARQISLVYKVDSSDNFYVLTIKSTTAYLLKLESDTSVTEISSRTVDGNYVPAYYEYASAPFPYPRKVGNWPRAAFIGTPEKYIEFTAPIRDII